ncbi:MAG: type II toxin-antitoxin system RelE family toxin [Candidatus Nanoarchaeia archaeon]
MYDIQFSKESFKFLEKLKDKELKRRLLKSIFLLKLEPYPKNNFKLLEPYKEKIRIRVGKYRILYTVKEKELVILIITIDKRGRVYK